MKPTRTLVDWSWDYCEARVGRALSDGEKIQISCIWAGQAGHEKCGWCSNCLRPRFIKMKNCDHSEKHIHGKE